MTVRFTLRLTPCPGAFFGANVAAVPAALAGFYDESGRDNVTPDRAQVRAALPYRWRKAFDHSGSFWFDKDARIDAAGKMTPSAAYMHITNKRGRTLATVYAIPWRDNTMDLIERATQ